MSYIFPVPPLTRKQACQGTNINFCGWAFGQSQIMLSRSTVLHYWLDPHMKFCGWALDNLVAVTCYQQHVPVNTTDAPSQSLSKMNWIGSCSSCFLNPVINSTCKLYHCYNLTGLQIKSQNTIYVSTLSHRNFTNHSPYSLANPLGIRLFRNFSNQGEGTMV